MADEIYRVLKSDLIKIANAIRTKRGTSAPIDFVDFESEILAISGGGSERPQVPQTGTWQFKTTPTKGLLIIGKDDDTADEAKFVRMLEGYGFKFVLNTEPSNVNKGISPDADSEYSLYPSGTTSHFPEGVSVKNLCKYVIANNLGEIAQHDESSQTLWSSQHLDDYMDGFYSTYTSGGGTKTKAELKQAILDTYADTDIQQGADRVTEQRTILEDAIESYVLSIGQWGGTPNIVIDNITVGTFQNLKTNYNTLARQNNYYADSWLANYGPGYTGSIPYSIVRESDFSEANAESLCESLYADKWCAEIFGHSIINYDTQEEWEDFKDVLDKIKFYVDDGKIEVVTRTELYNMGEFVANPIKSISAVPNQAEYQVGSVITESNFLCRATLNDNTIIDCQSDRIIDLSRINTATAGAYTVTVWYRGFKTTCTVTVVSSGLVLPEWVQEQTSGYYQTFRFSNDTDKCYCIYLDEYSTGFNGAPYTYGGAWIWQPKVRNNALRIFYSADGSSTWTQLCNTNMPASLKSNVSTYFGSYIFGATQTLTLGDQVHISPKTVCGLKVSKTVSRYSIGSTVSTSDITVKAINTDGTENTVTATFDTTEVSTANVGVTYIGVSYGDFSGKLPITIYDSTVTDDNILQLEDSDLYYADGVEVHIRDNVIYLNGTSYADAKHYLKISNGLEYNPSKAKSAWKSETIDDITSGNTYSYALLALNGTIPSGLVGSVRDSGGNSILSASSTPQTLAEDSAYINLYWGSNVVFDNVALGVKVVSGSTAPTVWTPSGQDNGIEISIGITDFTIITDIPHKSYLPNLLADTEYVVMQGIAYHDGYYYCGVSETSGASNMEYVLAKIDASDGTIVGTSSADHYLGHCNGVTYCDYDGYLHCVSLDNYGTINRLDTNLNYIDSYQINLSDKYAQFSGIGGLCYDATREQFVYLLRGDNKKYAIYQKDHTTFVSLNDVTAQNGTYGGVLTDDKYIYQATYINSNNNYIYRYDWKFNLVEKMALGSVGELETLTWKDGLLKYNTSGGSIARTPIAKS